MKAKLPIAASMCAGICLSVLGGCATAPTSPIARDEMHDDVANAVKQMEVTDPNFHDFLTHADGYVVFPTVGKGAAGVGGAFGRGEVFEQGKFIGYADISQATIGAQLGGQSYAEVIAFERPWALDRFKEGQLAFSANASAVALTAGAAASAKYTDGVAVFVAPQGGLMAEASVGGQDFSFEPQ
jgi:lipid-binding SYLF domain-containing protein